MLPNKQAYRKFGDNYNLMEISFAGASRLLASILFGSWVGRQISPTYWGYVFAAVISIATFALLSALWVLWRLPKLEFKDRRLDPVQRRKIADYLKQFPKRQVRLAVTTPASREDGLAFAADIKRAIADAWDILERDGELAYEAENFDTETSPGHKFRVGVSVYGAKGDPDAKGILRNALEKAGINLYVDTSVEYEDRIIVVVGMRETSDFK